MTHSDNIHADRSSIIQLLQCLIQLVRVTIEEATAVATVVLVAVGLVAAAVDGDVGAVGPMEGDLPGAHTARRITSRIRPADSVVVAAGYMMALVVRV